MVWTYAGPIHKIEQMMRSIMCKQKCLQWLHIHILTCSSKALVVHDEQPFLT